MIAWAVSGSVSLELMMEALPTVILYKLNRFDLWIARPFIKAKFITLVNLLANAEIMPEYLTGRDVSEELMRWAAIWLGDPIARAKPQPTWPRCGIRLHSPATRSARHNKSCNGCTSTRVMCPLKAAAVPVRPIAARTRASRRPAVGRSRTDFQGTLGNHGPGRQITGRAGIRTSSGREVKLFEAREVERLGAVGESSVGSGWTSINSPSAPAASAARAMGGTYSRLPVP